MSVSVYGHGVKAGLNSKAQDNWCASILHTQVDVGHLYAAHPTTHPPHLTYCTRGEASGGGGLAGGLG